MSDGTRQDGGALASLIAVSKRYPRPEGGAPSDVLAGVSLSIGAGEAVAVVGPSGAGKTTLLNLLGLLDRPDAGSVSLDGADVSALDEDGRAQVRAERLGFVFQQHRLLPQCTALENVLVPTIATGRQDLERAESLLAAVGLADRMHHRPGQLSVGECQRVAVARALINQPALVLADEPTGALDQGTARRLVDLLWEVRSIDPTPALLVVTHDEAVAARMDRVLELSGGRLQSRSGSAA